MSETDSFIEEVTEEVRREKLYTYMRRYGWIGVVAVLALVGGAAFTEFRASQARAAAEATGNALVDALNLDDEAARAEAIATVDAEGPAVAITALLTAAAQEEAGDYAAAIATLNGLVADDEAPEEYRDLAAFKAAMLPSDDADARMAALSALAQPGQPFRLLAMEQMAYMALEAGDQESAMTRLGQILEDAAVTAGLRDRVETLMVALGEPLPEPATE